MKWCKLLLIPLVMATATSPAPAGHLFGKRPKPNPTERVPVLLMTVKTDPDEHKRAAAAEELRQFDAKAFPEILTVLAHVGLHDPKVGVRLEAIQTLGRVRPISREAGWVLEQAAAKDPSIWVRLQARNSLLQYRLHGYHGARTQEPPLAGSAGTNAKGTSAPQGPVLTPHPETPPPPLADPGPASPAPQPLPAGTQEQTPMPVPPPHLIAPPSNPEFEGPRLTPP
jgi:hypothetical protein